MAAGDFNHAADFTFERIHKMSHPQSAEELENVRLNLSGIGECIEGFPSSKQTKLHQNEKKI